MLEDEERTAALKAFIEAAEDYREDNIQQSDKDDEGLEPIVQSPVKPAVQRLQRIYGRGERPKLPYPQSVTWRKLVRRTDPATPIPPEECGSDIVEGLLNDLVEWAQAELRGAVVGANRAEPAADAKQEPPHPPYTFEPPDRFQYGENDVTLTPTLYKLLEFLLEHRKARLQDVIKAVWGHDSRRSPSTVKSAASDLNRRLAEAGIPVTVSKVGDYFRLSIDRQ